MAEIFDDAKITEVYYPSGVYDNTNVQKLIRAPFILIKIANAPGGTYDTYVAHRGIGDAFEGLYASDTVGDAYYQARTGIGYINDSIVINENEMGDWQGQPNSWKGMHQIGMI